MTKRVLSLFVLTLLIVAMFSMATEASRVADQKALDLHAYGALKPDLDNSSSVSAKDHSKGVSLGTYGVDGTSPGYIVYRSYNDHPVWFNASHLIDWRHTAKIHMIYMAQFTQGDDETVAARWPHYNAYSAVTGTFINGSSGVPYVANPSLSTGGEPQIDVDNVGAPVATFHRYVPVATGETANQRTADALWEFPAGSATFISDTIYQSLSQNPEGSVAYPYIEYQENGGTFVTHILATEFSKLVDTVVESIRSTTYWRRVGAAPSLGGWTTPLQLEETDGGNAKICAARGSSQDVAIVYLGELTPAEAGNMPFAIFSHDMGATWDASPTELINFDYGSDGWSGWVDIEAGYDSDDYLHVIWPTFEYDGDAGAQVNSINPNRIFHWTNRVAGPHSGGSMSIVAHVEFNFSQVCGRGWTNEGNVARPVIGECNDRLYVLWQQFGDPEFGDSTDCADESVIGFTGSYNSEIMMSVSLSKDGELWDRRRNITNSTSPGCTGATDEECDSDQYPSVARYGMNGASLGSTNWSAVPEAYEIRDALDAGRADDGTYLDMLYVDDAFPGNTRWSPADPQVWTNNPVKWARIPCVPPVIEPSINVVGASYLYPSDWVKSGTSDDVVLTVENLGNATLNVSDISVTAIDAPGGSIGLSTTTMAINPAESEDMTVTINPGGAITTPAGTAVIVHATVDFTSDDPNRPLVSYLVNTVVTDSVVQVVWDTVATGNGYGLIVSNHGNGGMVGIGTVNLDFVNTGEECTAADSGTYTEDVYLYSSTPLIMQSSSNFSWNPFYSVFDPKPYNFQPVPGAEESNSKSDKFLTGTFVTSDSSLGLSKTTWVPDDSVTASGYGFVVEQMKVYSYDGGAHNDVRMGAWMDWDIPSDTGSNNEGGVEQADGYAWMTGLEYNPGMDCTDSDGRFGASGMLGYYFTSELGGNPSVNHTDLDGAYVHLDADVFEAGSDSMIVDSVWEWLGRGEFTANNSSPEDQQIMLAYGAFNIPAGDTLIIYTVHATVYAGDQTGLSNLIADAKTWYMDNRDDFNVFSCCGTYTGGFPGNTDCDTDGKRNLADITRLIDHVYISKADLCCGPNGNVDGDPDDKHNLADITKLIDNVYISKAEVPPCL
jgi:hypothetical protein